MRRKPGDDEGKQAQDRHQAAGHEGAGADITDGEEDEQGQSQDKSRLQAPDLTTADAPPGSEKREAADKAADQRRAATGLDEAEDAADNDQEGVDDDDE